MAGKKVLVGMSGGVDSSVTALLLKRQGYEVEGVFMHNWNPHDRRTEGEEGEGKGRAPYLSTRCSAEKDYSDAADVCRALGVRLRRVSFERQYWTDVFEQALREIEQGLTPNPDVLCNRHVKFSLLTDYAFGTVGADYLATGHYAQLCPLAPDTRTPSLHAAGPPHPTSLALHRGVDPTKDQSYFLGAVAGGPLQRVLFPLGGMRKTLVRKIAQEAALATAGKRDSTGICFVGNRPGAFSSFLRQYIQESPGGYELSPHAGPSDAAAQRDWAALSRASHSGVPFYTIGEGLRVGGLRRRWFVCGKDLQRNTLLVAPGTDSPALFSSRLTASPPLFTHGSLADNLPWLTSAKARSVGEPSPLASVLPDPSSDGGLLVRFEQPQRALTPGQFLVFYHGDRLCGSAQIRTVLHEHP